MLKKLFLKSTFNYFYYKIISLRISCYSPVVFWFRYICFKTTTNSVLSADRVAQWIRHLTPNQMIRVPGSSPGVVPSFFQFYFLHIFLNAAFIIINIKFCVKYLKHDEKYINTRINYHVSYVLYFLKQSF